VDQNGNGNRVIVPIVFVLIVVVGICAYFLLNKPHLPAAASWSSPVKICNYPTSGAWRDIAIDIDSAGTVHAVFVNGADNSLYYSYSSDGVSWSSPKKISGSLSNATSPCLVIDSSDYCRVVFSAESSLRYLVGREDSWTPPTEQVPTNPNAYRNPSIDVDSDGLCHIVSATDPTQNQEIYYIKGVPGNWASTRFLGTGTGTGYSGYTSVAVDRNGTAHIVYSLQVDSVTKIFYEKRLPSGWQGDHQEQISDNLTNYTCPWIDLDDFDRPRVVFSGGGDHGLNNLYYNYKDNSWLSTLQKLTENQGNNPCLKVDDSGICHISYNSYGFTGYEIRYLSGHASSWSSEAAITSDGKGAYASAIALDSNSKCHVVYHTIDGPYYTHQI